MLFSNFDLFLRGRVCVPHCHPDPQLKGTPWGARRSTGLGCSLCYTPVLVHTCDIQLCETEQKYLSGCDHLAWYRPTLCTVWMGAGGPFGANLVSKPPPSCADSAGSCSVAAHPGPCLLHMSTFDKALLFPQQYSAARAWNEPANKWAFYVYLCGGVRGAPVYKGSDSHRKGVG